MARLLAAVFAFSLIFGYRDEYQERENTYRIKLQLITLIIAISYSALTEIMQVYIFRGRYGSFYDFMADVIGCLLGVFVFKIIFRKKMIKN